MTNEDSPSTRSKEAQQDIATDVLAGIRDHVRAERADDAALEAIARGELGSEAVAELEQRGKGDPDIAAMIEASRPLGGEVEARIAAKVGNANAKADAKANAKANANAKAKGGNGNVLPFVRRVAAYAAPITLAAAVLLYVTLGGRGPTGAMLPDYAVVASGEKEMRGPAEAPAGAQASLRLRGGPDASFEIVARPTTAAGKKVVAYVFAIGEGEREPNAVDASVDIAAEGSVRIRGRARALDGAREVRVVLGTAGESITRFDDALSRARDGKSDAQVRVLVVRIER